MSQRRNQKFVESASRCIKSSSSPTKKEVAEARAEAKVTQEMAAWVTLFKGGRAAWSKIERGERQMSSQSWILFLLVSELITIEDVAFAMAESLTSGGYSRRLRKSIPSRPRLSPAGA